ncbi:MAG: hypothetical protein RM021_017445 [Nostoc sp. EkiNYC01]|nr:hypothetical protein [Nostoc sp. EkiNYC01]
MSKNKNGKLEGEWLDYSNQAIAINAPAIQRKEMRRAFYAGASAMFNLLTSIDDSISEEEGAKVIDALQKECIDFMNRLGRDR